MSASSTTTATRFDVLERGLRFPEAPRWHAGRLYYSDLYAGEVRAVDLTGRAEVVARVPAHPSGLGWRPDGTLLVVSMQDRRLLGVAPDDPSGSTTLVADLSILVPFHCNDMVVDARGRAYVGNFGSDVAAGAPPAPTALVLVTPDGRARRVAEDLVFPNGMVITPDGATLIVAETFASRLTAFDVADDGSLSRRRVFAELGGALPDGICLDAEDAVWVAAPFSHELLRVRGAGSGRHASARDSTDARGEIVERMTLPHMPVACALGGPDGRTLFVLTTEHFEAEQTRARSGRIELGRVAVAAAV